MHIALEALCSSTYRRALPWVLGQHTSVSCPKRHHLAFDGIKFHHATALPNFTSDPYLHPAIAHPI